MPYRRFGADLVPDFGQMGMRFEGCFVLVSAGAGVSSAEGLGFDVWFPSGLLTLSSI